MPVSAIRSASAFAGMKGWLRGMVGVRASPAHVASLVRAPFALRKGRAVIKRAAWIAWLLGFVIG